SPGTFLSDYEIIIVGSGFAALPILEGLPPGTRILIIEGGGAEERPEDRQLNLNDEYGHFTDRYFANHLSRCFGGASRLWAGVVAPLDSRDFEGSRNLPAWPISAADIH